MNPSKTKKQITIRLDEDTIDYFKNLAEDLNIPYQNLINLYLRDCAGTGRKLSLEWTPKTVYRQIINKNK